jgi:uncharacterized membrane protein
VETSARREPIAISERDASSALIHLYRGELGRMTQYRVRLDTTTNWAVGTTAAIATVVLSTDAVPHYVFALPMILNVLFLSMEARRFRGMALIAERVRLIERGFYARLLGGEELEHWEKRLAESLRRPKLPISYLQAFSVRLRRNYVWMLGTLYLAWLVKLDLAGEIRQAAAIGRLPGSIVLVVALAALVPLVAIAFLYHPPEEG